MESEARSTLPATAPPQSRGTRRPAFSAARFPLSDHALAFALAALFAVQAGWFAASTSGTPDETTSLRAGLNIYHRGDFRPLADDGIAPLPVLVSFAAPALLAGAGYSQQILAARVSAILLIGVPFILLVYASLLHACGRAGA